MRPSAEAKLARRKIEEAFPQLDPEQRAQAQEELRELDERFRRLPSTNAVVLGSGALGAASVALGVEVAPVAGLALAIVVSAAAALGFARLARR
jgi:hypothetical protein